MPLFRRGQHNEPFPGLDPIPVTPIGWVRNDATQPDRHDWTHVRSRIVLDGALLPALAGLDGFSHILVVTWLDRVPAELRRRLAMHPAGDRAIPVMGALALRTHHRPNPIGVSAVSLERVDGVTLHVRGLDVADRTPVLDIKPYIPHYDSIPQARLPGWTQA